MGTCQVVSGRVMSGASAAHDGIAHALQNFQHAVELFLRDVQFFQGLPEQMQNAVEVLVVEAQFVDQRAVGLAQVLSGELIRATKGHGQKVFSA